VEFSGLREQVLFVALLSLGLILISLRVFRRSPMRINTDAADEATLNAMRKAGSDLAKPTEISHYLHVSNQEIADQVAADLSNKGYRAQVISAEVLQQIANQVGTNLGSKGNDAQVGTEAVLQPNQEWLVVASKTAIPTIDYFRESRAIFKFLAYKFNGKYDGWEAGVEE
jgi:hypothetical protein